MNKFDFDEKFRMSCICTGADVLCRSHTTKETNPHDDISYLPVYRFDLVSVNLGYDGHTGELDYIDMQKAEIKDLLAVNGEQIAT